MSSFAESFSGFVEQHFLAAIMLLLGATGLLALGSLAVLAVRSPVKRQRLADLTLLASLVWLALACVPLPRPGAAWWWRAGEAADVLAARTREEPDVRLRQFAASSPSDVELAAQITSLVEMSQEPPPELPHTARDPAAAIRSAAVEGGTRWSWWPSATMLTYIWLVGATAALVWLLTGRAMLARISRSRLPVPRWFEGLWRSLPWPRRQRPQLVLSPRVQRAMTWGLWRATIALPASICQPKRCDQLRHIMLHEMGHILRGDCWSVLISNLALPVLYFHPLYWFLRGQSRMAAELLADDWAAGHSSPETYVQQLIAFVKAGKKDHALAFAGLGFFENPTRFYRRMHMLLHRKERLADRCGWFWRCGAVMAATLVTALAVSCFGVSPATAQAPEEAAQELYQEIDTFIGALAQNESAAEQLDTEDEPYQQEIDELQAACRDLIKQAELLAAQVKKLEARRGEKRQSLLEQWRNKAASQQEIERLQQSMDKLRSEAERAKALHKQQLAELAAAQLDNANINDQQLAEMAELAKKNAVLAREQAESAVRKMAEMAAAKEQLGKLTEQQKAELDAAREQLAKLTEQPNSDLQAARQALKEQLDIPDAIGDRAKLYKQLQEKAERAAYDELRAAEAARAQAQKAQAEMALSEQRRAEQEKQKQKQKQKADNDSVETRDMLGLYGQQAHGTSLDVMALATQLIDAQSDLEESKAELKRLEPLRQKGFISEEEITNVEQRIKRAQRKTQLLTALAEISLASAEEEAALLQIQVEAGVLPVHEGVQAKQRMNLLRKILESGKKSDGSEPSGQQGTITPPLGTKGGIVLQSTGPGKIAAYAPKTKELLWETKIDSDEIQQVNVSSSAVTLIDSQGRVWELDVKSGKVMATTAEATEAASDGESENREQSDHSGAAADGATDAGPSNAVQTVPTES